MPTYPRVLPAGDRAFIVEFGEGIDDEVNARVHRVTRAVDGLTVPGVLDLVPAYRSLTVHVDPLALGLADVERLLCDPRVVASATEPDTGRARVVEIPVVYGGEFGPDLADVASHCGLSVDDVVAVHAAGTYRVFMMGFTPGFPYLGGLSPRLATPRLPSPRTSVPAGSVGIAGQQTGVYPTASPGGWRLIGRTSLRLFDPSADPPCAIEAGDTIRFVPVTSGPFNRHFPAREPLDHAAAMPDGIVVIDGGLLTTVQDLGRYGYQRFGVPVSGAMDVAALRLANRLAGNADHLAGLEMTLTGPVLRFDGRAVAALAGADLGARLNGRRVPGDRAFTLGRGDVLSFDGQRRGVRAYLAVQGGIPVPEVLRSRSTYLASGFGGYGGRALRAGDRLPLPPRADVPAPVRVAPPPKARPAGQPLRLRVVLGPQIDAFTEAGRATFLSAVYTLSHRADRVGCRLEGPTIEHAGSADIVSDGTAFGAVQVSGDGQPLVLMADRGTTGGYTRIATVISADLSVLAQAMPGDRVSFDAVPLAEAVRAARDGADELDRLSGGSAVADHVFDEDAAAPWAADGMSAFAAMLAAGAQTGPRHAGVVRAGMAGVVVEVCVAPGEPVDERATLIVVEAMKMQNPVRAPRAGRVTRVLAVPGAQVGAGTIVVELED